MAGEKRTGAGVCAVGYAVRWGLWVMEVEGWEVEGWEVVGDVLDGCWEWWGVECFIEGKKGGRERL
jgi:hypothetical protein